MYDFVFCSGGEDLCLWDINGKLLCKEVKPDADSKSIICLELYHLLTGCLKYLSFVNFPLFAADIHSILPIKKNRLVVAFSKQSLGRV